MTVSVFRGRVGVCTDDHGAYCKMIDGVCLTGRIEQRFRSGRNVTVSLGVGEDSDPDVLAGRLIAEEGSRGYSEYTPGEPAKLAVGDHDVLNRLADLQASTVPVLLVVADEPVDFGNLPHPEVEEPDHVVATVKGFARVTAIGTTETMPLSLTVATRNRITPPHVGRRDGGLLFPIGLIAGETLEVWAPGWAGEDQVHVEVVGVPDPRPVDMLQPDAAGGPETQQAALWPLIAADAQTPMTADQALVLAHLVVRHGVKLRAVMMAQNVVDLVHMHETDADFHAETDHRHVVR